MRPKSTFLMLLIVAVTMTVTVTAGAVAGQTDTDPGIDVNPIDTGGEDPEIYEQEIDNTTRLVESEYSDERGGFALTFESDASTRITFTEAVQFQEGAGSGRIYVQRIPAGMSEVFVAVERRNGQAAVTMTTTESISQNRYSYVSTGRGSSAASLPTTSIGWGVTIGIVTMTAGMAIAVRRKQKVDHMSVDSGWK